MPLLPDQLTISVSDEKLEGLLHEERIDLSSQRALDEELLAELYAKNHDNAGYFSGETGLRFVNGEVASLAKATYGSLDIIHLETFLNEKESLSIPIVNGFTISIDGTPRDIQIVAATDTTANHGEMSSMLYLRDHIQAASVLMELSLQDPENYHRESETGHSLLLSALHLMSTPAQLARFKDVIARGKAAGQADWPHISLLFDDLEGEGPNNWRNKQDTFQMLAYLTLDAIERGFLDSGELAASHKEFLGSIVPLLAAVGFPKYENSGSWEEITAERTSVMAVETALLHKIKRLSEGGSDFDFLKDEYDRAKDHFPLAEAGNFTGMVDTLLHNGLLEVGRNLPDESPHHDSESVKFRQADAALTYVLMYDLPRLLEEADMPIGSSPDAHSMTHFEIEDLVLRQLATLADPDTNGIMRYDDDSYQRVNFHTNEVQWIVNAIKRKVQKDAEAEGSEIDLDKKQSLRNELTPRGRSAAWTHSLGQLAGWAARQSIESFRENDPERAHEYQELSTAFLNRSLSTITGANQWHAVLGKDGRYKVQRVPAYRLPECYVTYQTKEGEEFIVPSPHTPLNWSSATTKQAIGLLRVCVFNAARQ